MSSGQVWETSNSVTLRSEIRALCVTVIAEG